MHHTCRIHAWVDVGGCSTVDKRRSQLHVIVLLSRCLVRFPRLDHSDSEKLSLQPMASIPKKRKSGDALDTSKSAKQSKIQTFFTPRVSLSTTCGADQTTSVAKLNDEQNQVLQMVVEEEKSVFFTGSAGERTLFLDE